MSLTSDEPRLPLDASRRRRPPTDVKDPQLQNHRPAEVGLRRNLEARRKDVGSVRVAHVVAPMRASMERVPSAALSSGPDVAGHVIAQIFDRDVQQAGKPLLDLYRLVRFEHLVD